MLVLLALTIAFLVASPGVGLAEDEITASSSAVALFPTSVIFSLEAASSAQITDIELLYRVERQSLVPVSYRVDVDFTPGLMVNTSWTWNMLETGGLPAGTEFEYWWLIEDAAGHQIETPQTTIKFDDLRYHWNSQTSGQITIFWYEGDKSFAQELMDAADGALEGLASETGASLGQPVKIYIYGSYEDLHGALVYPQEWTGGVAFPDYGTIAIGISPGNLEWGRRAIAHELGHMVIYQATLSPYADLPVWLDEGLAMHAEGELRSDLRGMLNRAIAEDALFSVRALSSPFPADPDSARLCYAESYSLVEFLIGSYGGDKILELLDVFKEGSTYDDALLEVYGFDMDGLNAQWRQGLGLGPEPAPTPEVSGMPLYQIALIVVVVLLAALAVYLSLRLVRRKE